MLYSPRFEFITSKTFSFEGLYQANSKDRSNYTRSGKLLGTMRGISTMAYEQYLGREPLLAEIKAITVDIAKSVYYKLFWLPMRGDQIKTDGVAWVIFDSFIATGNLITARKGINKALTGNKIVETPTSFNDYTLQTINAGLQAMIVAAVIAENVAQRKSLSTFSEFGAGWIARLIILQAEALKLLTPVNVGISLGSIAVLVISGILVRKYLIKN